MPASEAWENLLPLLLTLCLLSFVIGYLLGSIPFGLILAKFAGLGDLRQIGSGNIGATNVLRTGNKLLAALTLLLDLLKGTLAVWVGSHLGPYAAMAAGARRLSRSSVSRCGSAFAAAKALPPISACCSVSIGRLRSSSARSGSWSRSTTRYSSLAALVASIAAIGMIVFSGQSRLAGLFLLLTVLLYIRHASNIERLARGEEARIGETKL